MSNRTRTFLAVCGPVAALALAGCQQGRPTAAVDATQGRAPADADATQARTPADSDASPPQTAEPSPTASASPALDLGGGMHLKLIPVPAGKFTMGTASASKLFEDDERPGHEVILVRPFLMGKFEVTQAQWEAVMDDNPSQYPSDFKPVHNVSWEDCQTFCERLSERSGRRVRLPTEAEWEYACRAGSTTLFSFGDEPQDLDAHGWFEQNSNEGPQTVGTRKPNPWGLHDLHGNVFEWCADWYDDTYYGWCTNTDPGGPQVGEKRVLRGGCWYLPAWSARSSYRARSSPQDSNQLVGLRVVVETED